NRISSRKCSSRPSSRSPVSRMFRDVLNLTMMFVRSMKQCAISLTLFFLCREQALLAAQQPQGGRELFRQQCAKCHGREGQGVKGKYDDPLHGDWSLEKLARYITKSMPDDAPGTCSEPEAVARYIYDAFYSRDARVRNHPPRVELVRLTNRQYLNTVSDLLKHFSGADKMAGDEHGLRGSYRSKMGKGDGSRKSFERVD